MKTKKEYIRAALHQLQRAETRTILQEFNKRQIPVLAFKGVTLQERIYAAPELRDMCDIDLLIHRSDLLRIEQMMLDLGYSFFDQDKNFPPEFIREYEGEISFNKNAMLVELHWKLIHDWFDVVTRINLTDIWERALPIKVADQDVLRLSPEDEVLYLCFHTVIKHNLQQAYGIYDIVGVLKETGDSFNWHTLVQRAFDWHLRISCWAVLDIIRSKEPELIPDWVLNELLVPLYRQKAIHRLTRQHQIEAGKLQWENVPYFGLRYIDSIVDIWRIVKKKFFPGQRFIQLRYKLPPSSAFWHQFIYPIEAIISERRNVTKRR